MHEPISLVALLEKTGFRSFNRVIDVMKQKNVDFQSKGINGKVFESITISCFL